MGTKGPQNEAGANFREKFVLKYGSVETEGA